MNEVGPRLCVWGEGEESEGADGEEVRGSGDHLAQKRGRQSPDFWQRKLGGRCCHSPHTKQRKSGLEGRMMTFHLDMMLKCL